MLAVYSISARDRIASKANSALPGAPILAAETQAPAARPRRALAALLVGIASRVAPEPVERSRWQSG